MRYVMDTNESDMEVRDINIGVYHHGLRTSHCSFIRPIFCFRGWMDDDELKALMSGMVRRPDVSEHIAVIVKPNVVALLNKASASEILHLDVLADFKRRCNEIILRLD